MQNKQWLKSSEIILNSTPHTVALMPSLFERVNTFCWLTHKRQIKTKHPPVSLCEQEQFTKKKCFELFSTHTVAQVCLNKLEFWSSQVFPTGKCGKNKNKRNYLLFHVYTTVSGTQISDKRFSVTELATGSCLSSGTIDCFLTPSAPL